MTISEFWSLKRITKTGCWEWVGRCSPKGYGTTVNVCGVKLTVHRMAWLLTNGNNAGGLCVCHTCDNRRCYNPAHLFLGSYADNNNDRVQKGRSAIGSRVGASKLSDSDVMAIRRSFRKGNVGELSSKYGVSRQSIYDIVYGVYWKHLPLVSIPVESSTGYSPFCKKSVRLDTTKINRMRRLRRLRYSYAKIASVLGVSLSTVWRALKGVTWKKI